MGRLVLVSLLGNRFRTASTIVAVQLAVTLVCVLWAMPAELDSFLDDLTSEARLSVTHRSGLTYGLPPQVARRVRELPGVRDAMASTYFGGSPEEDGRVTFPSMAVEATRVGRLYPDYGIPAEQLGAFIRYRDAALAGEQTLRRYGWQIGDRIALASALWGTELELEIVGALPGQPGLWLQEAYLDETLRARGGGGLPWNSIVWIRLAGLEAPHAESDEQHAQHAQRGQRGQRGERGDDGSERAAELEAAVEAIGRELGVPLALRSERSFYARLLADLRGLASMLELVGVLVAACVAIVAASSISLGVRDRARELATLRALGWSRHRLVALVLSESALIGASGGAGGVLGAVALVELARAVGRSELAIGMLASARIDAATAAVAVSSAALVGSLAGLLPALGAARQPSPVVLREVPV